MEQIIKGEDGFLFVGKESNKYTDYLLGTLAPSPADLDRLIACHLTRLSFCKSLGIQYFWILVPSKERILSHLLPADLRSRMRPNNAPIHALLNRAFDLGLHRSFASFFIDLSDALRQLSTDGDRFHRTDTHWTHRGAWSAYQHIIQRLNDGTLGACVATPRIQDAKQQGDLGRLADLGPEPIRHFSNPEFSSERQVAFSNEVVNNGGLHIIEGTCRWRPRSLILRSSSFDYFKDFFLTHFSRSMTIFGPELRPELLMHEKPDYVFHFQQERYMLRPPQDASSTFVTKYVTEKGNISDFRNRVEDYVGTGGYFVRQKSAEEILRLFRSGQI